MILENLAIRLEHDGERGVALGDFEQICGLATLEPQRGPSAGPTAGEEERTGGRFAECCGKEGRICDLAEEERVEILRIEQELARGRGFIRLGEAEQNPIVRPDDVDIGVSRIAIAPPCRERPRRVNACPERAEQGDAPVPDLISKPFHDDAAVRRHCAGCGALIADEGHEVLRGPGVQVILRLQNLRGLGPLETADPAGEGSDGAAELEWSAGPIAVPERHLACGAPGSRCDDDPVLGDLVDPPGRRAEHEPVAGAALEDHLLVELTNAGAVGQGHPIEAPIRDRAGVRDRQDARVAAAGDGLGGPIPHDPRPKPREFVRRVASGEHVEHRLEHRSREIAIRGGSPDQIEQGVRGDRHIGNNRNDLLRQHIERALRDMGGLDGSLVDPLHNHCRFEQIATVFGEDLRDAGSPNLVPGPPHTLQSARHRRRSFNEHDQIDGCHVDTQFEGGCSDNSAQVAALEPFLNLGPLLARDRAVM